MSVAQQTTNAVPVGTWATDPVHSSLEFSVKHMVVATFRSTMPDFTATLTSAEDGSAVLEGTGRVASVETQDPNLTGHLQSPDFFDAERHPEVRFRSTEIVRDGEAVTVRGELDLKGRTGTIELSGTLAGPVVGLGDAERLGLDLEGAFDRTEYGLDWNAELPGGGLVVGNTVRVAAHLELVRS